MAGKAATTFLVDLPTEQKKVQVTIEIPEADHKALLDYMRVVSKQACVDVSLDSVAATAFQYLIKRDRLYRQLSGKAKPKKKAGLSNSESSAKPKPKLGTQVAPQTAFPSRRLTPTHTTLTTSAPPSPHSAQQDTPKLKKESEKQFPLNERMYVDPLTNKDVTWFDLTPEQQNALKRADAI